MCGGWLSVFDKLYPHHQSHFLFSFIVASTERRDQPLRKYSLFLLLFVDGRKINLIPSLFLTKQSLLIFRIIKNRAFGKKSLESREKDKGGDIF